MTTSLIPTNVITGFLGSGKTTAILHLLKSKPTNERWAVLVNEFGEVGIDGDLISNEAEGVSIREVPGGCMCCTSGVPMQVALNQLIQQTKPDRLLIEPTGLGHPKEVLSVLRGATYQSVLKIGATLCMLDARKFSDKRYTEHETFNQQLLVSDYIIANKIDQYEPEDSLRLQTYLEEKGWSNTKKVQSVQYGEVEPAWLDDEDGCQWVKSQWVFLPVTKTGSELSPNTASDPQGDLQGDLDGDLQQENQSLPSVDTHLEPLDRYKMFENYSQGFYAYSWLFASDTRFHEQDLKTYLTTIRAERIKALFQGQHNWFSLNFANLIDGEEMDIELMPVNAQANDKISTIEIITTQPLSPDTLVKKMLTLVLGVSGNNGLSDDN